MTWRTHSWRAAFTRRVNACANLMRLALFGGTFDPIHSAHLTVAREAADQFHLDQVWFVPAAHPPHKSDQTGAGYEDRCKMVELACQGDPRLVVSRLESGAGKSYSIDTIERVRASGEEPLFHHRRRRIRRNYHLASLAGPGPPDRIHRRHPARPPLRTRPRARASTGWIPLRFPFHPLKSGAGWRPENIPAELPPAVAQYIVEKGLYHLPCADSPFRQPSVIFL